MMRLKIFNSTFRALVLNNFSLSRMPVTSNYIFFPVVLVMHSSRTFVDFPLFSQINVLYEDC